LLVRAGVIGKMFFEPDVPGDPFEVSDADTMLNYLNPKAVIPEPVTVFTRPGCPHCAHAKALLEAHGMQYEEITLDRSVTSRTLRAVAGADTVPQVYVGGRHIGGADDLEAWFRQQDAA